jgi:hypothetical protein
MLLWHASGSHFIQTLTTWPPKHGCPTLPPNASVRRSTCSNLATSITSGLPSDPLRAGTVALRS